MERGTKILNSEINIYTGQASQLFETSMLHHNFWPRKRMLICGGKAPCHNGGHPSVIFIMALQVCGKNGLSYRYFPPHTHTSIQVYTEAIHDLMYKHMKFRPVDI